MQIFVTAEIIFSCVWKCCPPNSFLNQERNDSHSAPSPMGMAGVRTYPNENHSAGSESIAFYADERCHEARWLFWHQSTSVMGTERVCNQTKGLLITNEDAQLRAFLYSLTLDRSSLSPWTYPQTVVKPLISYGNWTAAWCKPWDRWLPTGTLKLGTPIWYLGPLTTPKNRNWKH